MANRNRSRIALGFAFLLYLGLWTVEVDAFLAGRQQYDYYSDPFIQKPRHRCTVQPQPPLFARQSPDESPINDNSSRTSNIIIRDCLHGELGGAVDVIMNSFYHNATNLFKPMLRLAELNRLQQGFPYANNQHRMLVAKEDDLIVGFCDIDNRPPTNLAFSYNPRPYLSDLCIHTDYRQRGIARQFMETCEKYAVDVLQRDKLYMRVERSNTAALSMYRRMEYHEIQNEKDGTVLVLCKDLSSLQNQPKHLES